MSKNKAILIGRLGADPEVRYTPQGDAVCNFSLATDEKWTDRDSGEKKQRTEWHRIVAWRKLAEICGEYLVKGKQVYVEGKIRTRSWENDGITRYTTEIVIDDMIMLSDPGQRSSDSGHKNSGSRKEPPPHQDNGYQNQSRDDDDIPF